MNIRLGNKANQVCTLLSFSGWLGGKNLKSSGLLVTIAEILLQCQSQALILIVKIWPI